MFIGSGTSDKGVFMDNPELLASAPAMLAAVDVTLVKLRMDGVFDDKIKQLQELKDTLDSKQAIVSTLEDAEKIKSTAQALSDEVDARNAQLKIDVDALNQAKTDNAAKDADLKLREESLQVSLTNIASQTAKLVNDTSIAQSSIDSQTASIKASLDSLNAATTELADQKRAFNEKLAALKA